MEFTRLVGTRRSIRWFKSWEPVPREKIQRILEHTRWTTCPGNLQPWRAIVVYRDELSEEDRNLLLQADNWQGAHVQAPVWIYWYADIDAARPEAFVRNTHDLLDVGAIPGAYGWARDTIKAAIQEGVETPEGMASIQEILHNMPPEVSAMMAYSETVGTCAIATLAAFNEGLGTCLHTVARPSFAGPGEGSPRCPRPVHPGVEPARRLSRREHRGRRAAAPPALRGDLLLGQVRRVHGA